MYQKKCGLQVQILLNLTANPINLGALITGFMSFGVVTE